MQLIFKDYETFWSDDYTLKKLTPPEYIMDPRFETHGCAFVMPDDSYHWVDGPELPAFYETIDWPNTMVVSHNALFDMLILSLRYGIVPGFYGDTLAMARNWVYHLTGNKADLRTVGNFYGLPPKGHLMTKGLSLSEIKQRPGMYQQLVGYALDDALICKGIFRKMLAEGFPPGELDVIDMVVRMAAVPQFEADQMLLAEHLAEVQGKKQALLDAIQMDKENVSSLMSDQQLAIKLHACGLQKIPMKMSKATGKETYAFAKTDREFTDLLEHDNPMIQALVAARLGVKSTLEESRTTRLINISRLTPNLPIPLKYSGAHTHRFSGDWRINPQNLPNGGKLRDSLKAPKGKKVVSVDASQIEARFNAVLSGQDDLVEDFRTGVDVYALFAEPLYGYPVSKQRTPRERFVGKTSILSLGYGSSWPVFQNMCRVKGDVLLTDSEAMTTVNYYRSRYAKIQQNWRHADITVLPAISEGHKLWWGPVLTEKYAILLPNGNRLRYNNLGRFLKDEGGFGWRFDRGSIPQFIYGAKAVENVVQALAFVHIMAVAKEVKRLTGGWFLPAHQVHDELIYIVDEAQAKPLMLLVIQLMSTPPVWMPNAPLAAEGRIGDSYGGAH